LNSMMTNLRMIYIFSLFAISFGSEAQNISYDTTGIAPGVKKDANVVVRSENIEFEVSDIDQSKLHVHRVETVLNERGKNALLFEAETDRFTKLDDIEIKVYDATGKQINKYKQRDLIMIEGVQEFIDDYKTYLLDIKVATYPVTIETDYVLKYKGSFMYPAYQILSPNEGVEYSSFKAKVSKNLGLRYKENNIHLIPVLSEDGEYKVYTWTVNNLSPIHNEENSASFESRYPSILLAPNQFKLDKYQGDMTSWRNFGLWYNMLLIGVDTLPDQRKQFYRDMVKNYKTDEEKEKILYSYLQDNFRYVSIQLGIGGFKPLSADFTDTKKYGDCKGLSNYLATVLRSVGIKCYMALIKAESNQGPIDTAFPCNQFNHVIICIPGKKDSTWLECTSKTIDFGELVGSTKDKKALLITENGGVLVPTPRSRANENELKAYTTIDLHDDGTGKTNTIFTACGEYKWEMMGMREEKADEQKLFMINRYGFKDPDQIIFDTTLQQKNVRVTLDQQLEMIPELKTGTKMFLRPSVPDLWSSKLPKAENRKQDFYFDCPFVKIDTTLIKLPDNYRIDAIPQSVSDSCKYASYHSKYWYDEKTHEVYSASRITLSQYKIPAEDYGMIKKFFDGIMIENEGRIVVKKE
jgi:Domain of Unknown Function with PDB structure (DUF3857)/Transglutaminase-like superfamily